MALCTATGASAQINEADRLERCANNRNALAEIEARLPIQFYSDAELEQFGGLLLLMRVELKEMREAFARAGWEVEADLDLRNEDILEESIETGQRHSLRIQEMGEIVGVRCMVVDEGCPHRIIERIEQNIDESLATRPIRIAAEEQAARYRTNLIALGCDRANDAQAAAAPIDPSDYARVAGRWQGSNGYEYNLAQSGNQFSWVLPTLGNERGIGTIAGNTLTATWEGSQTRGAGTGTVERDARGNSIRISWTNGVVFTR